MTFSFVRRFIEKRPDDRIGLIGFANQAYSFAPPMLDHDWGLNRLSSLRSGEIGDATSLAAPVYRQYREYAPLWAGIVLALILAGVVWSEIIRVRLP